MNSKTNTPPARNPETRQGANLFFLHPLDNSTRFLSRIYKQKENKTLVCYGASSSKIRELLTSHEQVVLMGHGTSNGLLSVERFPERNTHVIDEQMVPLLKRKKNNVFIWCYASQFAEKHGLKGFCTEMFISEVPEASWNGIIATQEMIDASNNCFADIIGSLLPNDAATIYEGLMQSEYKHLAKENPVAAFNFERFHLFN